MKRSFTILFALLSFSCFAQVNVGVLKGVSAVPFADMMENPDYTFTLYDNPSDLITDMKAGKIDAANIGARSAEKLVVMANGALKVEAVTSTSDFVLVGRRTDVQFSSLPGRKVAVAGNSLAKELFLYLLEKNNIPLESGDAGVEIVEYDTQALACNAYINNSVQYVVTSEPATSFMCRKSKRNFISMDLQEQYKNSTGKDVRIPLTVLIMRTQLLTENEQLASDFKSDVENSLRKAVSQPGRIAGIAKNKQLGINGNIAATVIKNTRFTWKPVNGDFHLIVNQ